MDEFIIYLDRHDDFRIHRHVDQFYYMEKKAEMRLLLDELKELNDRLSRTSQWLDLKYREVLCRWCEDRRWINRNDTRQN